MDFYYTCERNAQIVLSLLKQYGIRKVIASPGTTNITLVATFFEMYSAADERSAAYLACGLSAESGEPVVLSCTGATASRNYVSGLTEAYYRKLPVLAVTATQSVSRVGHHVAQVIDRSQIQKDIANYSTCIKSVKDADDEWDAEIKANKAIQALLTHGGGPVHINLETQYGKDFSVKELPVAKVFGFYDRYSELPPLPKGKIAVFMGSHRKWTNEETFVIDCFCSENDAVVFCDHTSGYHGKYRVLGALVASQVEKTGDLFKTELTIHIGEVSGDYAGCSALKCAKHVWRVNEDGVIRDTYHHLSAVFEMPEVEFFKHYVKGTGLSKNSFLQKCKAEYVDVYSQIPAALPFSNSWVAMQMAPKMPENSVLHLGILNSLRSWNMFEVPSSVYGYSNVGGFGIDGGVSSLVGASLANPQNLYFGVFGDLAFFYDINVLANRHVGNNLRIMLINNGRGTEFRNYNHPAARFGEDADKYMAAAGHYGNKSVDLIRHFAEDLGYRYLTASNKEEFFATSPEFLSPAISQSYIYEVFTDSKDESDALYMLYHIVQPDMKKKIKNMIRDVVGKDNLQRLKDVVK